MFTLVSLLEPLPRSCKDVNIRNHHPMLQRSRPKMTLMQLSTEAAPLPRCALLINIHLEIARTYALEASNDIQDSDAWPDS